MSYRTSEAGKTIPNPVGQVPAWKDPRTVGNSSQVPRYIGRYVKEAILHGRTGWSTFLHGRQVPWLYSSSFPLFQPASHPKEERECKSRADCSTGFQETVWVGAAWNSGVSRLCWSRIRWSHLWRPTRTTNSQGSEGSEGSEGPEHDGGGWRKYDV